MKRVYKSFTVFIIVSLFAQAAFSADIFNKNLTQEEQSTLDSGKVLIKNIGNPKKMCLNTGANTDCDKLIAEIKALNPKYLAEIIQIKPYKGNENLPEVLEGLLYNVSDYVGIPYYSVRAQAWYNLYDSAQITSEKVLSQSASSISKEINADLVMDPFGTIHEVILLSRSQSSVYYSSVNTNKLRYKDDFDCVWPRKLKICIILIRDGDNWILYGAGGVNAPRIPFFTERIETSFINRINTFCNFIFTKF
ncbi:MAG: hypothetical protein IK102_07260 [Treponema sp.]|nr:hypothetical protein [Treponema sp.]